MAMLAIEEPVNLRSDNVAGVAPEILAAIEAANAGTAPSYGADPITARLQETFAGLFETRCFVQPVATGDRDQRGGAGADRAAVRRGLLHRCRPRARQRVRGRGVLYRRRQDRAARRGAWPAISRSSAPGVRLVHPVESNEIFALMPRAMIEELLANGFGLYDWGGGEVRLVTAFNYSNEQIDAFVAAARRLA